MTLESAIPVKVALRCRPLPSDGTCTNCVNFVDNEPQIVIGDKSFTYDYVFHPNCKQVDIYDEAILPLVECIFKGYNATVLAYGQTGSGKTHTMGGGWGDLEKMKDEPELVGVIPRVVSAIYDGINNHKDYTFSCRISYMEIYKETLIDLLTPRSQQSSDGVQIREDTNGPKPVGLKILEVKAKDDMLVALNKGALERTTGSTAMNSVSSRSHAIFTIYVDRISVTDSNDICCSKFHLVDLAGSERAKRTKAEGSRFKEGVNINMGLLSLGNVISALGEEGHRHIPYRDSKLTRLLQDSLGGNSHTLMIACISPDITNYDETLSCLRYADRARMIKNKPIVNHDPQIAEILRLKSIIQDLRGGKNNQTPIAGIGGTSNDTEKVLSLTSKLDQMNETLSIKEGKINSLSAEVHQLSLELTNHIDQNLEMHQKVINLNTAYNELQQMLLNIRTKSKKSTADGFSEDDHIGLADIVTNILNHNNDSQSLVAQQEDHNSTFSEIRDMITDGDKNGDVAEVCDDVTDSHKRHALNQAKYARELNDMSSMIARKEEIMRNFVQKDEQERKDLLSKYEDSIKEHKLELQEIQKENDDLTEQLAKQIDKSSSKCQKADDRKNILKQKTAILNKKIMEQAAEIKSKEVSVKRCELLSSEIKTIKQNRVKLMKQMKLDSDTFRKWKKTKEKEVTQLRAKDRKLNLQLSRINSAFSQQRMVMKRKTEEANLANKRLKDALSLQSKVATERNRKLLKAEQEPVGQRIKTWLSHEMEILVSGKEARNNLEVLISDRVEITKTLDEMNSQISTNPASKRRMLNRVGESLDTSDNSILITQMAELNQDLEQKNNQIVDIRDRLAEVEGERAKNRWDFIKNMTESKLALKWLMNQVVTTRVQRSIEKSINVTEINRYKSKFNHLERNCDVIQENQRNIESSLIHLTNNENIDHSANSSRTDAESYQSPTCGVGGATYRDEDISDENRVSTPLNTTYNKITVPKNVFQKIKVFAAAYHRLSRAKYRISASQQLSVTR